jgi:hypothetical protein
MKRFVIRKYGPSAQFNVNGENVCLVSDRVIETDDVELAEGLKAYAREGVHITDRGSSEPILETSVEPMQNRVVDPEDPEEEAFVDPEDPNLNRSENPDDLETETISYDEKTYKELKEICKERNISTRGLHKPGLIEALEQDDIGKQESQVELEESQVDPEDPE